MAVKSYKAKVAPKRIESRENLRGLIADAMRKSPEVGLRVAVTERDARARRDADRAAKEFKPKKIPSADADLEKIPLEEMGFTDENGAPLFKLIKGISAAKMLKAANARADVRNVAKMRRAILDVLEPRAIAKLKALNSNSSDAERDAARKLGQAVLDLKKIHEEFILSNVSPAAREAHIARANAATQNIINQNGADAQKAFLDGLNVTHVEQNYENHPALEGLKTVAQNSSALLDFAIEHLNEQGATQEQIKQIILLAANANGHKNYLNQVAQILKPNAPHVADNLQNGKLKIAKQHKTNGAWQVYKHQFTRGTIRLPLLKQDEMPHPSYLDELRINGEGNALHDDHMAILSLPGILKPAVEIAQQQGLLPNLDHAIAEIVNHKLTTHTQNQTGAFNDERPNDSTRRTPTKRKLRSGKKALIAAGLVLGLGGSSAYGLHVRNNRIEEEKAIAAAQAQKQAEDAAKLRAQENARNARKIDLPEHVTREFKNILDENPLTTATPSGALHLTVDENQITGNAQTTLDSAITLTAALKSKSRSIRQNLHGVELNLPEHDATINGDVYLAPDATHARFEVIQPNAPTPLTQVHMQLPPTQNIEAAKETAQRLIDIVLQHKKQQGN